MNYVLQSQQILLGLSPALLPLGGLIYSFLNSWHCSLMCGPFAVVADRRKFNLILVSRIAAYTAVGALMGSLGFWLKESLELQLVGALAFIVFAFLAVGFVLPQLLPAMGKFNFLISLRRRLNANVSHSARGFLMAAIPCHLLVFYYGLAALTASPAVGALLLFGHAVMTTPAFFFARNFKHRLSALSPAIKEPLRYLLILLVFANLLFLGGHLFYPADEVKNHLFFCL